MTEDTQPAGAQDPREQAPEDPPPSDATSPQPAWPPPPLGPPAQTSWPPPAAGGPVPSGWPPQPPAGPPAASSWPPPPAGAPDPSAWPPPPAGATAPWPPAVATRPPSTPLVVVAGIFLLVAGILTFGIGAIFGLLGGLIAVAGSSGEGFELLGPLGGVVAGLAFLVVFWGLLEVVAAIGMLIHRGWGRALGLIVGVAGALFAGLAVLANVTAPDAEAGGIGFSLLLLAGYGLTVLALVTGGEHFRRRA